MKAFNKVSGDEELYDWLKSLQRGGEIVCGLFFSNGTDAGVEALAQCPNVKQLEKLVLHLPKLTDAGMKALAGSPYLSQLVRLGFSPGTPVTDDGLKALVQNKHLANLGHLNLGRTHVTDVGVVALAESLNLSQLAGLRLNETGVTDVGLKALAGSPHLSHLVGLVFSGTHVANNGIKALAQSRHLTKLRYLSLDKTKVTDEGVVALAQSSNLSQFRSMKLSNTGVTDYGIKALAQSRNIANLRTLNLSNTKVTDDGMEALVKSPFLSNLTKLKLINTVVTLPLRIIHSHNAPAIFKYFRESRLGKPLLEVKVPLLGMGGLGKTLLSRHLAGVENAFKKDNPATHAFEVRDIPLTVHRAGENHACSIRLFDFGGQPELHGAHRFFLADKRNVYVIVVSARLTREKNRLDYWLRMVKHHGSGAPVVVVVTHCDNESGADPEIKSCDRLLKPPLDAAKLSADYKLPVKVVDDYSNVNGANIGQVRKAIVNAVASLNAVFDERFAPGFFDLRSLLVGKPPPSLQNCAAFKRYWKVDDHFRPACKKVGQTDRQQQYFWLILLRDLGYVHYVGDHLRVKPDPENVLSKYLFHPEWVKTPVYNVVRLCEVGQKGGIVSFSRINESLRRDHMSDEDILLLLRLMGECALIFRVRGSGVSKTSDYLVADQVESQPPDSSLKWDNTKRMTRWHFEFLPDYLLAQLVGRWFAYQPKGFTYYRDEVILEQPGVECRVRLRPDFNNHILDLEFDHDRGIDKIKERLSVELENLLDPEGVLPKRLWQEEDLSTSPEEIDGDQVTRIAELLLIMVKASMVQQLLLTVTAVVRRLFENSKTLTPAEKLAFRICTLFAYAKDDLVELTEFPKPRTEFVRNVLAWLKDDGAKIRDCFKEDRAFKTLESEGSFRKGYASALKKRGITSASMASLERHAQKPDLPPDVYE